VRFVSLRDAESPDRVICTDIDINAGLLLYTHGTDLIQVQAARNELRGLVMSRNELASYLHVPEPVEIDEEPEGDDFAMTPVQSLTVELPPPVDDDRSCARCYAADSCMLYRRVRFPSLAYSIWLTELSRPARMQRRSPMTQRIRSSKSMKPRLGTSKSLTCNSFDIGSGWRH
jgi:hypothetical protein